MNTNNLIINNKLIRITFKGYDGKYWCWVKKVKHPEFERDYIKSYHCYKCKGEFIFFHDKEYPYTDNPPFKFHNILTKQLEKKENDWKTGRETKIYQAICCKCALLDKEINYCGCDIWIKDRREQETKSLEEINIKIAQNKELIKYLETKLIDDDSYLSYRICKYLKEEEEELADSEKRCDITKRYLNNLNIWEGKLNEIKKELEAKKFITKMKRKEQTIPLSELLAKTETITIKKEQEGYWLFGEIDPEFYNPQEIKPLKEGENLFAKDFKDGNYQMELIINDKELVIRLLKTSLINCETFKLNKLSEEEWETTITLQMLFWLSDFNLFKDYEKN